MVGVVCRFRPPLNENACLPRQLRIVSVIVELWSRLRRSLTFWLWFVLLSLAPAATFGYDCGSETKQAYNDIHGNRKCNAGRRF